MSLAVLPDLATPADETLGLLRGAEGPFRQTLSGWPSAPAYAGNDRFRLEQAAALAAAAGMPLMAVNDVLYHAPERRPLQDVLTAIRLNVPVAEAGFELAANAERHLKPPAEMARLFRRHPASARRDAALCRKPRLLAERPEYNYPDEPTESGLEPQAELERLTWEGAARPLSRRRARTRSRRLIRHELEIVGQLNYARYFLTVHDIVKFARSQKHPLPGARLGRQFGHLLLPRHHRCRARHHRHAVRALHLEGAQRAARHRRRFRARKARRGHRLHLREIQREAHRAGRLRRHLSRPLGAARGRQGDGPFGRCAQRAFRLDLGLVVTEARRKGSQGRRPRPDRSGDRGMSSTAPTRSWAFPATSPSMSAASSSPGTGSTRSCRSSRRRWTSARWSSGTRTTSTRSSILKVDVLALGMLSCLRRAFDLLERSLRRHGTSTGDRWSSPRSRRRTSASTT